MITNHPRRQHYWRLVIATGAREECTTAEEWDLAALFRLINSWNAMGAGKYQYWQTAQQRKDQV